jgi:hypothetical protein
LYVQSGLASQSPAAPRQDAAQLTGQTLRLLPDHPPSDPQGHETVLERERVTKMIALDPIPLTVIAGAVELD